MIKARSRSDGLFIRDLTLLFGLAFLVRALTAYWSCGFDHPNEPYRLLEPLIALKGYSTRLPWEWSSHLLSRIPVFIQSLWLGFGEQVGVQSPMSQIFFLRLTYAFLSLLPVWAAVEIVRSAVAHSKSSWKQERMLALLAGYGVALWPEQIYQSVRLMDYTLEAAGLACAVILLLRNKQSVFKFSLIGIVLGSLFFVRFQTGLHFISILLVILFLSPEDSSRWKKALLTVSAYIATIGILGLWEASGTLPEVVSGHHAGGNEFLTPFLNNFHYNWAEGGASRDYGADPWHRYLSETAKYFGVSAFTVLVALAFSPFSDRKMLLLWIFPIFIHSFISHKEGRFVFGTLWLLIPVAVTALRADLRGLKSQKWIVPLCLVALTAGALTSASRVSQRLGLRRAELYSLSSLSQTLKNPALPIVVHADPTFHPVGFWLRTHQQICYSSLEANPYPCEEELRKPHWQLEKKAQNWRAVVEP